MFQYTIKNYLHLNDEYTNQALLDALQVGPVYVQIGVHPTYFQFYTPDCQDPVHAGFNRPTFAGVLTGYDLTTVNEEFWELYIRRHEDNYNKVKLACVFEKNGEQRAPFAGLASKMYQIDLAGEIKPVNRVDIPESGNMIVDTESLKQAVQDAGGNEDEEIKSIKLPLNRVDCSSFSTIDFSSFVNLVNLIVVADDPMCLMVMKYPEGVNLVIVEDDNSSSIRRLQSDVVKELNFIGAQMGSILFGNNLFNNYNYKIHIESRFDYVL